MSKLVNGINAHTFLLKKNSIQKNIKNKIIPSLTANCMYKINLKYKEANLYLAHYIFKDVTNFIERKLSYNDGNFKNLFRDILNYKKGKELLKKKKEIIDFHKNNKEIIINYIFDLNEKKNILDYEKKLPELKIYKKYYLNYYKGYGNSTEYFENKDIFNYLYK